MKFVSLVLRFLFFFFFVRPIIYLILGLNVRHSRNLPDDGPAILVANHNSHLDAMVLMCLLPIRLLSRIHPLAAADYFLRNKLMGWFSMNIVGIIPVDRRRRQTPEGVDIDPLAGVSEALKRNDIIIFFPEGSRGEPEKMVEFKKGISHLAQKHPEVPIIPVFLHGLGKALPKGEGLLVPFFVDVFVGSPLKWTGDLEGFRKTLELRFHSLSQQAQIPDWL